MTTTEKIMALGKKLMADCPENDCAVFLNIYKMYCGVAEDLNGCLLSDHGRQVLEHEKKRLSLELERMYFTNYAVQKYKRSGTQEAEA